MKRLIEKADSYIYKIQNQLGTGFTISMSGNYEVVPEDETTPTRIVHEDETCSIFISHIEGPTSSGENIFDLDMEVELMSGELVYTFVNGVTHHMKLMEPITIKAGTRFSYKVNTGDMVCIFKMYKK